MVEAHGARTVYMRLRPEGRSVGAAFRVASVKSPILSNDTDVPDEPSHYRRESIDVVSCCDAADEMLTCYFLPGCFSVTLS